VDTVKTGRVVEVRESVGTVRAFESITVTARVAGTIKEIRFEEGQAVKAGDVLVQLDADERRAEIEQAIAEANRANALKNEIAIKLDRAQALSKTGAGTGAQVDDLTAQVKSLDSSLASAQAQRKAAEARLEELTIRAPFAGRVGTRSVSLGAYISPGTRVTSLDDLTRIRLDFAVPENLLDRVKAGQTVTWTNEDDVAHNVIADSGASFKSDLLNKGGTFTFTPKKAGTIEYECTIHPGMKATLNVQ